MGLYGSPDLTKQETKKEKKPKKSIFKRWWFWAIVIIVIIALGSQGGDDKPKLSDDTDVKTVGNVQDEATATPDAVPEMPEFFGAGETAETKKVKAAVTGIEKPTGNAFSKPSEGKEYVLINMTIENISDGELNISSLLSFDTYVDDEAINEDLLAQTAKEDAKTMDGTVAAGKKLTGALAYEVPTGWKQIEIHFQPDQLDDTVIKWLIDNE